MIVKNPLSEPRNGLLCALVIAACVVATYPVAETGFQDDWSYIRTALDFARTGHFVYNGWATAMLGWIIPWSALFIKIFGFSFTLVRASLLPFTMACIYLFHSSLVRFGVRGRDAVLGTLTLGLSPIFVPLAASYMTDVAGMFVMMLCLYLCQRAIAARSDRSAVLWLCCAAAGNIIGGTVRQIVWLGALVMVPATAWLLRRRRSVLWTVALLWLCSIGSMMAILRWWNRQPFSVPEKIVQGPITVTMLHHLAGSLTKGFLCFLLVLFPILAGWFANLRRRGRSGISRLGEGVIVAAALIIIVQRSIPDAWLAPWLTHMIQSEMRGSGEFPGVVEIPWPAPWRELISLMVVASVISFADQMISRRRVVASNDAAAVDRKSRDQEIFWLLVPFSICYLALLLPRGLYALLYDRYFLGLMPLAIVALLRWYRQNNEEQMPALCFWVLGLFGAFSIAATHDWYAVNRARIAAVSEVLAAGVPRTAIQGAFELDGWTQIDAAGYVNEPRIEFPAGVYHENTRMYLLPIKCRHFFGWYAPAINPKYVVTSQPSSCFAESNFSPIRFRIWLPPFHREVYVQEMRGAPVDKLDKLSAVVPSR
jgi:hypothetical protein